MNKPFKSQQALRNVEERSEFLKMVAEVMAKEGMFEQALQVATSIEDESDWSKALSSVAEAMAKAGLFEQPFQVARIIEDA